MLEAFLLELARGIISLFVIVDPLGSIPIFVGLTRDMSEAERRRTFRTAVVTGFSLLLAFAVAGRWVLNLFDIRLYSLVYRRFSVLVRL